MSATTNFIQFNPTQANQETDSQYAADSLRSGGAVDGNVFEAPTANKLFYQLTTMVAALGTMLAQKGYSNSDANFNQLVSVLSNIQTAADIKPALQVLTYGPTLTFDCAKANGFEVLLAGNVTSVSVINATPGQIVTFILTQGGNGNHTFVWPSVVHAPGQIETAPATRNIQRFICCSDGALFPVAPMTSNS